ncbi:MAG: hypothetical protein U0792_08590 [Gemmataceae bacterium]
MHLPRLTPLRAALVTGLYAVVWGVLTGVLAAARSGTFGDLTDKTVLGLNPVRSLSWVVDPGGWIGLYFIGGVLARVPAGVGGRSPGDSAASRGRPHSTDDFGLWRSLSSRSKLNPFSPAAWYRRIPLRSASCYCCQSRQLAWMPEFVASSDDGVVALRWDEH